MAMALPTHESSTNPPPDPCCTYDLCCGLKGGWRDLIMFTVEGGSAAATATAMVLNSWYLGAGIGLIGVGTGVVHCLWRRDAVVADLHRVVVHLAETNEAVAHTADRTDEVVAHLRTEHEHLEKEKEALLLAQNQFEQQRLQFTSEVDRLQSTNQKISDENKELSLHNKTLTTQINHLQETIKAIKASVEKFNHQNQALKGHIGALSDEVEEFGQQDDSLLKVLADVDKALDEDIAELAEQVALAQQTSREVFLQFSTQIKALTDQISELKTSLVKLNQDRSVIQAKTEQLGELQKRISESEDRLHTCEEEFEKINQALIHSKTDLAKTLQSLKESEGKLSSDTGSLSRVATDLNAIATRLDALGDRLEHDEKDLKTIQTKTDSQEKEINDL